MPKVLDLLTLLITDSPSSILGSNWEPLKQRYKINKTIFVHKGRNDTMPSLTNLFKLKLMIGMTCEVITTIMYLESQKQTL